MDSENNRGRFNNSDNEDDQSSEPTLGFKDLRLGYTFHLDEHIWKIIKQFKYTWEDGTETGEFEVHSNIGTRFMEYSEDMETQFLWMEKANIASLQSSLNLTEVFSPNNTGIDCLSFQFKSYFIQERARGRFQDLSDPEEDDRFWVWDYKTEDSTEVLSLERWDWDGSYDLSHGVYQKIEDVTSVKEGAIPKSGGDSWQYVIIIFMVVFGLFFLVSQCNSGGGSGYGHSGSRYYHQSYRSSGGGAGK